MRKKRTFAVESELPLQFDMGLSVETYKAMTKENKSGFVVFLARLYAPRIVWILLLWGNYAVGVGLMGRSEVFGRDWEMYMTGDEEEDEDEEVIRAEPIWKWKHLTLVHPRYFYHL